MGLTTWLSHVLKRVYIQIDHRAWHTTYMLDDCQHRVKPVQTSM